MQRSRLPRCADVFMMDLAHDSCLGKSKAIIPLCRNKFSLAASASDSGRVNPQARQLPGHLPALPHLCQNRPNLSRIQQLRTTRVPLISTSGGVPLKATSGLPVDFLFQTEAREVEPPRGWSPIIFLLSTTKSRST
jgi:hypothetical protein